MPNDDKEKSLKGINSVHPANRLIYLKLIELREVYRNKSPNISISLTKAIGSLKRYPLPISEHRDITKIAGLGIRFAFYIHRVFKDKIPPTDEAETRRHGLNNLNRVLEFMRNHDFVHSLKPKPFKPVTYSNAWTFMCILGFFTDPYKGMKYRLTLEDVKNIHLEFSKLIPKAKLKTFDFLKQLAEKRMLNFKLQGQEEIFEYDFKPRLKNRYSYGLTEEGKEMVEILHSKLEIPLDDTKDTFHKLYRLTNRVTTNDTTSDITKSKDWINQIDSFMYRSEDSFSNLPSSFSSKDISLYSTILSSTDKPVHPILITSDKEDSQLDQDNEIYFKGLRERLKIKYGMDIFTELDYEVITVVDKRELRDSNGKYFTKLTNFYKEAKKSIIFKQLPLGDVIWVIKINSPVFDSSNNLDLITRSTNSTKSNNSNHVSNSANTTPDSRKVRTPKAKKKTPEEIEEEGWFVLDWVLERKTTLDLNSSIMDGRYEEQKIRLLNLKGFNKVIYLFEDSPIEQVTNSFSKLGQRALNYKAILTAKMNTRFISGFNAINTSNISHSACMLLYLHLNIENFFKEQFRNLRLTGEFDLVNHMVTNYYSFAKFKEENRKRFKMTYYELFGRQLRCIPKLGEQLTCSILTQWPTPYLFYEAINNMSLDEINKVLSQVRKKSKMSKQVYDVCRDLFKSSTCAFSHLEVGSDIHDALQLE